MKSNINLAREKLESYFDKSIGSDNTFYTNKLSVNDAIEIENICYECNVDFALGSYHVTIFEKDKV